MASVKATVSEMIYNYPSLFKNRTQALHHLFAVIGNGYEWYEGELVSVFNEPNRSDEEILERLDWPLSSNGNPELRAFIAKEQAKIDAENALRLEARRNHAQLALMPGPLSHHPYPPSKYAAVLCLPEDVTADWRTAAREFAAVVLPLWEQGEHLRGWDDEGVAAPPSYLEDQRREVARASEILAELLAS